MNKFFAKLRNWLAVLGALILAVLGALIAGRKKPGVDETYDLRLQFRQEERRRSSEEERKLTEHEKTKAEDRSERFQDAESIRHKILSGGLIILLSLTIPTAWMARAADSNPFIPADYETLKRYYLATWVLSEEYRGLYLEAENGAKILRESNTRLLTIIEEQNKEIEALRTEVNRLKSPSLSFGLLGGVTWSPAGTELFVGGEVLF